VANHVRVHRLFFALAMTVFNVNWAASPGFLPTALRGQSGTPLAYSPTSPAYSPTSPRDPVDHFLYKITCDHLDHM
jgi:hypothetical protein